MGCASCSSGTGGGTPAGCNNNGSCGTGGCGKLSVFDWLSGLELSSGSKPYDLVEVRFKNTRKEFFRNGNNLDLRVGDVVAVESTSGHDIGVVSLAGELVRMQISRKRVSPDSKDIRKIYRKASQSDLDKWVQAREQEPTTMIKAREIAVELALDMKISDVEYQGDNTKATFYYTADERVDFREMIKIFADRFRVRIEMRQIGARQEAGRVGGIGSCGRELCCSTWLTDFRSVSTSAARYQQLSINPVKLAGQCGKLKCCLNYELDSYMDALKDFPSNDQNLSTEKGRARHMKTDIFRRTMWYTYEGEPEKFIALSVDRVNEIVALNKKGEKVADLKDYQDDLPVVTKEPDYENVVGQDDLTRFDKSKKRKKRRKGSSGGQRQGGSGDGNSSQKTQSRSSSRGGRNRGGKGGQGGKGSGQGQQNKDQQSKSGQQAKSSQDGQNKGGQSKGGQNKGPQAKSGSKGGGGQSRSKSGGNRSSSSNRGNRRPPKKSSD